MILITGASGNVGREVVKQALAVGLTIRATFQSPDMAAKAPTGLEGVIMDYAKPETIRPALHGVEKIFLVGPPVRDLPAMEANFIKEVRAAGRRHVVKLSALGGRESIFPSSHRDSEENIEASGLPYTFLRPNAFMQNLVNYNAGTIRSRNAFYLCPGNGAVSMVDIRDIAAVAVIVLAPSGHEGKCYALTGGEALANAPGGRKDLSLCGTRDQLRGPAAGRIQESHPVLWHAGMVCRCSARPAASLSRGKSESGDKRHRATHRTQPISFDHFACDYALAFRAEA